MRSIVTILVIVLVAFVGFQASETVKTHEVSVTCVAAEEQSSDCLSFGPLGAIRPSGLEFWAASCIDHGVDMPSTLVGMVRAQIQRIAL
jgi:hypothetical protein